MTARDDARAWLDDPNSASVAGLSVLITALLAEADALAARALPEDVAAKVRAWQEAVRTAQPFEAITAAESVMVQALFRVDLGGQR